VVTVDAASAAPQNPSSAFSLDVVGIGALNVDYIASSTGVPVGVDTPPLMSRLRDLVVQETGSFEVGTETSVDEKTIYAALEEVSTVSLDATLGGSAFNAIFTLTQMQLGLRLGFVGVAGSAPVPGLSSLVQFDRLGVDRRFVRADTSQLCGICFSYTELGDRTLLTFPGANARAARYVDEEFDALVAYLRTARVVHVTSFLDPDTPDRLLALLTAVKHASPQTLISFDPGHEWSVNPTAAVEGLVRLSDFLLLNDAEFRALGRFSPCDTDQTVAANLLGRFDSSRAVVIVKRNDGILSFRAGDGAVIVDRFAQVPLAKEEIRDATGAGDIFAAGLLGVLASDRLKVELGCCLGMRLARHKLSYVGARRHAELAEITRSFLRAREAERRQVSLARGVFIAHGGDPQWRTLKEFVEQDCELPVFGFESDSWESRHVTDALSQYLDRCSWAVCVLTAEDATEDGRRRARQNVIHEAGLFQGRYGFDRVILLVEENCDFVPDAVDLRVARFPHGHIDQVFWQVHRMFRQG
jgi:sugar/nucleoside kinase (ribokinase family)